MFLIIKELLTQSKLYSLSIVEDKISQNYKVSKRGVYIHSYSTPDVNPKNKGIKGLK